MQQDKLIYWWKINS